MKLPSFDEFVNESFSNKADKRKLQKHLKQITAYEKIKFNHPVGKTIPLKTLQAVVGYTKSAMDIIEALKAKGWIIKIGHNQYQLAPTGVDTLLGKLKKDSVILNPIQGDVVNNFYKNQKAYLKEVETNLTALGLDDIIDGVAFYDRYLCISIQGVWFYINTKAYEGIKGDDIIYSLAEPAKAAEYATMYIK